MPRYQMFTWILKKNQQTNAQVKINTLDKRTSVERFQKTKKSLINCIILTLIQMMW